MHFSTILSTGLALVAVTTGGSLPLLNNFTSSDNTIGLGGEDILGGFGLYNLTEITTTGSKTKKYNPWDAAPFAELPQCYQDCIESNCCNGWPSLGDVRSLTVDEWCHSKWMQVQAWIHEHLQFCVKHACRDCRPECRDESTRWQNAVCAGY
ncbi:hypothetical protein F5Y13DRAFT_194079 [Hypoxylon sp. FL1857]|nr:hypothetical protein F5Y13DRAFT_194079 [Hypoxylon sp. FL1857]